MSLKIRDNLIWYGTLCSTPLSIEIIERTGSIEKRIMIKCRLWIFDIFKLCNRITNIGRWIFVWTIELVVGLYQVMSGYSGYLTAVSYMVQSTWNWSSCSKNAEFILLLFKGTVTEKWKGVPASNNFAEINRKDSWESGNPRKFPGIFRRKIGETIDSYSKEFLITRPFHGTNMAWRIFVTHLEKILITLSKEFLVTCNSRKFLVTNSAEKSSKMSTKFVEILWNFRRKFVGTNSRDFPGNYSQDFLKSSSGILFEKSGTWKFCDEFLRSTQEFPEKSTYYKVCLNYIFGVPHVHIGLLNSQVESKSRLPFQSFLAITVLNLFHFNNIII